MIDKKLIEQRAHELYYKHYKTGSPTSRMEEIIKRENIAFAVHKLPNKETLGVLLAKGDKLCILVNDNIPNFGRRNFTIAHELGHYALGHYLRGTEFHCDETKIKDDEEVVDEQEKEANYFASCFLLPKDKVEKEFKKWLANKQFKREIATRDKLYLYVDFLNPQQRKLWGQLKGILTKYFGVSETALKIRMVNLGLVNNFKY